MHDVLLQQLLLVGNLVCVGRLRPVLLHLLVGDVEHRLQLVLGGKDALQGNTGAHARKRRDNCRLLILDRGVKTLSSFRVRILASSSWRILSCSHSRLNFT